MFLGTATRQTKHSKRYFFFGQSGRAFTAGSAFSEYRSPCARVNLADACKPCTQQCHMKHQQ
eukprot:3152344-Amphidinium_carterae.1